MYVYIGVMSRVPVVSLHDISKDFPKDFTISLIYL